MRIAQLGRVGVWANRARLSADRARELEAHGYGAIWIGGSPGGDLEIAAELLGATTSIPVATGIVNMWRDDAHAIAAAQRRIAARFPDRFLLGVGIGHPEATAEYHSPYQTMVDYLDALDAEGVAPPERVLAALGPKALRLAAERTLGAHPYLTTPEHTRRAREIVGPGVLLAPEQKLVVHDDPGVARALGRRTVADPYLQMRNYVANLRRLGFADADFADGGSDRLVDALVGHGDAAAAAGRVREHLDAGADHVAIQVLASDAEHARRSYAELADALGLPA
ncbi:MAG TPA: TIGR03620 family F420-dependent LLM class oxidoreductase [Jatrophihabitans sp.]|nr:TIGR03620 family F420-dependent LLM class oxidoreductase [Jatrophihabitans sp.]